jgi:hypothetical protein
MDGAMLTKVVRRLAISALAMSLAGAGSRTAAAAVTLRVDAAEAGCPRRRDVVAALETRLPGVTRAAPAGAGAGRRLQLEPGPGGAVSLRLWDERGVLQLERRLGGDEGGRADGQAGCQAVADAAALVVERYLRDIGYRPPAASVPAPAEAAPRAPSEPQGAAPAKASRPAPAAAPPAVTAPGPTSSSAPPAAAGTTPRAVTAPAAAQATARAAPPLGGARALGTLGLLGAGGGLRMGPAGRPDGISGSGGTRAEVVLAFAVHRGWVAASMAGGVSSALVRPVAGDAGGELRLRSFPLRAHVGVPIALSAGALVPALGLSADVVSFRGEGLAEARSGVRFDPAAEAALGYVATFNRLYVRVAVAGGLTLAPRDYSVDPPGIALYRSPAVYVRSQVEVGVRLWKN